MVFSSNWSKWWQLFWQRICAQYREIRRQGRLLDGLVKLEHVSRYVWSNSDAMVIIGAASQQILDEVSQDVQKYAADLGIALDEESAQIMLGRLGPRFHAVTTAALENWIKGIILTGRAHGKDNEGTTEGSGNSSAAG